MAQVDPGIDLFLTSPPYFPSERYPGQDGGILDEIGTLSTVPGQNRDEKVGMVHGRLAYMRQVAVRSRDGARRTPSTTIVVHVVRSCTTQYIYY